VKLSWFKKIKIGRRNHEFLRFDTLKALALWKEYQFVIFIVLVGFGFLNLFFKSWNLKCQAFIKSFFFFAGGRKKQNKFPSNLHCPVKKLNPFLFQFCQYSICLVVCLFTLVANGSLRKSPYWYSNIRKLFNMALRQTGDCIAVRNPGPDVISLNAYL